MQPQEHCPSITKIVKKIATALLAAVLFLPCVLLLVILFIWNLLDRNHKQASEAVRDVAKLSRVTAGLAMLWAWLVAPGGLTAVGASFGIVSLPWIVALAPVLVAVAGATYTISAALDLYSKCRS
ncbi:MAG: hypothetical protein KKA54_13095 [Proteobacteria bacterium]|nr:hypothetical protein [Pseudomonadota bacterium]MBU0967304.1 hypothetical protein [Pseudomonadota bacterium]